jgi:hypothetical protein
METHETQMKLHDFIGFSEVVSVSEKQAETIFNFFKDSKKCETNNVLT